MVKKWVAYGATGVLGIAVISGVAVATAGAMELRTTTGKVIDRGIITGVPSGATPGSADAPVFSSPTPGEAPSVETPGSVAGPSAWSIASPGESPGAESTPDIADDDVAHPPTRTSTPSPISVASAASAET